MRLFKYLFILFTFFILSHALVFSGTNQWTDCFPIYAGAITVSPSNPKIIYLSASDTLFDPTDLYRSTDGGNTWSFVTSFGYVIDDIAIDPYSSNTVYIGGPGEPIFKSIDGCSTFFYSSNGLSTYSTGDPIWIDPVNTNIIYAGGYFARSTDYGQSWTMMTTGIINNIESLAINPINRQNLYGATEYNIYKSTNGGMTWAIITSGLFSDSYIYAIFIDPYNPQLLYLISSGSPHNFYKSTDGGNTWIAYNGMNNHSINWLLIDPSNSSTLYVATNDSGVYRSLDAGSTWANFNGNSKLIINLAISLASPTTLFAVGQGVNCYSFTSTVDIPNKIWQNMDSKISDSLQPTNKPLP